MYEIMNPDSFNFAEKENNVLVLVSHALFGSDMPRIKNEDIGSVWQEAYAQGVSTLAFSSYKIDGESNDIGVIKHIMRSRLMRNVAVGLQHARLHELMTNAGIDYVILKGCASAYYYPDPLLRDMGDVDFLVRSEDIERASDILVSDGFKMSHEGHGVHIVFEKDDCRYELHREPSGIPNGEAGEIIRKYFDDIFDKSVLIDTDFGQMKIPSPFHHGLIILMHTAHHMTGEGLGLRHINDFAVFENSFGEDEFVSMFYEKLNRVGLWRFACIMTKISSMFLGADERGFAEEIDENICVNIMKDVFSAGNFGQKSSDRGHEALIMQRAGEEKKRSKIGSLFFNANRIVYEKWSIAKKLKFLLPIGWLFFGVRYFIRSLLGKRPKINVMTVTSEAGERQKMYEALMLYKTNEKKYPR